MFRHPSYYKKLRERNKSDQVISTDRSRDKSSVAPIERSPGLGHKPQASSSKRQASSSKHQATSSPQSGDTITKTERKT